MNAFERLVLWILTILTALLIAEHIHMKKDMKKMEEDIDNFQTLVILLSKSSVGIDKF